MLLYDADDRTCPAIAAKATFAREKQDIVTGSATSLRHVRRAIAFCIGNGFSGSVL